MASEFNFDFLANGEQDPFIVKRAKDVLREQLQEKGVVRITYIALKQQLIKEFGETDFGRNKVNIQRALEVAIKHENPKVVEAYKRDKARQSETEEVATGTNQAGDASKSKKEKKEKAPKLYFYKMNEDEAGSAEGNRYIKNNDL